MFAQQFQPRIEESCDRLGEDDLPSERPLKRLDAECLIDGRSDHGEIKPPGGTDISKENLAFVKGDAGLHRSPAVERSKTGGRRQILVAKSAIARCAADKAANRFAGEVIIRLVSAAAKELPPHLTRDFPFAATAIVVVATW
jgi:hypothetical protein